MRQIAEFGTTALPRGRQIKFTRERLQQIKNLVERGKRREEIAELVGVTLLSIGGIEAGPSLIGSSGCGSVRV